MMSLKKREKKALLFMWWLRVYVSVCIFNIDVYWINRKRNVKPLSRSVNFQCLYTNENGDDMCDVRGQPLNTWKCCHFYTFFLLNWFVIGPIYVLVHVQSSHSPLYRSSTYTLTVNGRKPMDRLNLIGIQNVQFCWLFAYSHHKN